jgi:3-oxosteroid 1-dehydrogenase
VAFHRPRGRGPGQVHPAAVRRRADRHQRGRGGNAYDRYGGDPEARPGPNLGPLTDPPYYAVRVLAGTIGTKGGPVTDADGTVLTGEGTPIPGLYAVGNAAAFWTADAYPAPGFTLGIGMTMGYVAGLGAAG